MPQHGRLETLVGVHVRPGQHFLGCPINFVFGRYKIFYVFKKLLGLLSDLYLLLAQSTSADGTCLGAGDRIERGFVPDMRVPGIFYVNKTLEPVRGSRGHTATVDTETVH